MRDDGGSSTTDRLMTVSSFNAGQATHRVWQIPAINPDDRLVGGLSTGIAAELGVATKWVRMSFAVIFMAGGWGGLLYATLWGAMAWAEYAGHSATMPPVAKGRTSQTRHLGFVMIVAGLLGGALAIGGMEPRFSLPLAMTLLGLVTVRRQVSAAGTNRRAGSMGYLHLLAGLALTAIGAMWLITGLAPDRGMAIPIIFVALLLVIVAGSSPWWWKVVQDLDSERQARVRSEERADVAAHLHDSVLQTLALIQQNDGDPNRMAALARRQERELRNWLDPSRASRVGASVKGQIDEMITDVEELYGVPVEVVAVGDCLVDDNIAAALAATREAIVNASKHSGADRVDLFVEVTDADIQLFVRDTGKGFDIETIPSDRRGVRESIQGRMERAGGSVVVTSDSGEGTEVEIRLTRSTLDGDEPSQPVTQEEPRI